MAGPAAYSGPAGLKQNKKGGSTWSLFLQGREEMRDRELVKRFRRRMRIIWALTCSVAWGLYIGGIIAFIRYFANEEEMLARGFAGGVHQLFNFTVSMGIGIYVIVYLDLNKEKRRGFLKKANMCLTFADLLVRIVGRVIWAVVYAFLFAFYNMKEEAVKCFNTNLDRLIDESRRRKRYYSR